MTIFYKVYVESKASALFKTVTDFLRNVKHSNSDAMKNMIPNQQPDDKSDVPF